MIGRRRRLVGAMLAAPLVLPCIGGAQDLLPKLRAELASGARVVSHDYPLESWRAERTLEFDVPEKEAHMLPPRTQLFLYVVR